METTNDVLRRLTHSARDYDGVFMENYFYGWGVTSLFPLLQQVMEERQHHRRHMAMSEDEPVSPPDPYMGAQMWIEQAIVEHVIKEYEYKVQHSEHEKYLRAVALQRQEAHEKRIKAWRRFFGRKP